MIATIVCILSNPSFRVLTTLYDADTRQPHVNRNPSIQTLTKPIHQCCVDIARQCRLPRSMTSSMWQRSHDALTTTSSPPKSSIYNPTNIINIPLPTQIKLINPWSWDARLLPRHVDDCTLVRMDDISSNVAGDPAWPMTSLTGELSDLHSMGVSHNRCCADTRGNTVSNQSIPTAQDTA